MIVLAKTTVLTRPVLMLKFFHNLDTVRTKSRVLLPQRAKPATIAHNGVAGTIDRFHTVQRSRYVADTVIVRKHTQIPSEISTNNGRCL